MTESDSQAGNITGFLGRLKKSGEAAFEELSSQLLENEHFLAAMKKTLEAKSRVDKTVSGTMDFVNVPSKNDVARLLEEIEGVRSRQVKQQRLLKELQRDLQEIKQILTQKTGE